MPPEPLPTCLGDVFQDSSSSTGPCQIVQVQARRAKTVEVSKVHELDAFRWELHGSHLDVEYELFFVPEDGEVDMARSTMPGKVLSESGRVISGVWE